MSTARVTSLVLEVLAPDTSDGTSSARASGEGRAVASAKKGGSTSARASGEGKPRPHSVTAPAGAPTVTYAVIVDGRVIAVITGPLPTSTSTTLYFDLTGYSTPSIDDYFSEICQTFSSTAPTVDPGDIVPPWTKPRDGTNGKDGTNGLDGGVGPFPPASVVPTLIAFHADGKDNVTITNIPFALTEVATRMRTAYDLSNVCAVRVQCQVITAGSSGSELVLMYSDDNGTTWDYVSDPYGYEDAGPFVVIDATGDQRGEFRNIASGAQGDVLLSLFTRKGDGSTDPVIGNMGVYVEGKTVATDQCAILTSPITCPTLSAPVTLGPGGSLWSDNFTTYADSPALYAVYPFFDFKLYTCTDDTSSTLGGAVVSTATSVGSLFTKIFTHPSLTYSDITVRLVIEVLPTFDFTTSYGTANLSSFAKAHGGGGTADINVQIVSDGGARKWMVARGASPTYLATIDEAAFVAAGVHDIVIQCVTSGSTPGQIDVTVWDNTVLIGTVTYTGGGGDDWSAGFYPFTSSVKLGKLISGAPDFFLRALEVYKDGNPF